MKKAAYIVLLICLSFGITAQNLVPENGLTLPYVPQIGNPAGNLITDTTNWTLISGTFVASGGENFLTIGNFFDDANTQVSQVSFGGDWAYYYIDNVFVFPNSLQVIGDTGICLGDSITLTAVNDFSFAWADSLNPTVIIDSDAVLTVTPPSTITYYVYGSNDTITFTVNVTSPAKVELGNDTTLCSGETLTIDVASANATYLWQDNSTEPNLLVAQPGIYWVEVINICGTVSDTLTIELDDCICYLCVPDAFTPNNSGLDVNNRLYVFNKLDNKEDVLEKINFKVFNRWGEIVFEASEISQIVYPGGGWDGTHMRYGKIMPTGVYVWLMEAHTVNSGEFGPVSGNVSITISLQSIT